MSTDIFRELHTCNAQLNRAQAERDECQRELARCCMENEELRAIAGQNRDRYAAMQAALERCVAFINDNWQAFGYAQEPATLIQARAALPKVGV
jgi:septation ring formation regulator EzrA